MVLTQMSMSHWYICNKHPAYNTWCIFPLIAGLAFFSGILNKDEKKESWNNSANANMYIVTRASWASAKWGKMHDKFWWEERNWIYKVYQRLTVKPGQHANVGVPPPEDILSLKQRKQRQSVWASTVFWWPILCIYLLLFFSFLSFIGRY